MATTNRKMIDNPVIHRIVGLIRDRGKRERDLTDYLGLPPGSFSRWKYDGSYAYIKYIYEICEFLDTTPNYLFFGPEEEDERLTPSEKEMIRAYRSLDTGRRKCIQDTLIYFLNAGKKIEKDNVAEDELVEKPLL